VSGEAIFFRLLRFVLNEISANLILSIKDTVGEGGDDEVNCETSTSCTIGVICLLGFSVDGLYLKTTRIGFFKNPVFARGRKRKH
jgi:hypothetical protein